MFKKIEEISRDFEETAREFDPTPGRILSAHIADDIRGAFYTPIAQMVVLHVAVGIIAILEWKLGHRFSPSAITLVALLFLGLILVQQEIADYKLNSWLFNEWLKSSRPDEIKATGAKFGQQSIILMIPLIGYWLMVPMFAGAGEILDGRVLEGLSPALCLIVVATLLFLVVRPLRSSLISLRTWLIGRSVPERLALNASVFILVCLYIAAFMLPAYALNVILVGTDGLWGATSEAVLRTAFISVVLLTAFWLAAALYFNKLGPALAKFIPAYRGRRFWPSQTSSVVKYFSFGQRMSTSSMIFASPVFAAPLYALYLQSEMSVVFVAYNLFAGVHAFVVSMAYSRYLNRPELRLVRRAGAQHAAVGIVVVNVALALGYAAGWLGFRYYLALGHDIEALPLPGLFYAFYGPAPVNLPISAQIEAAVITILVLLAVSWLLIVISSRAWGEMLLVAGPSALIAFAPHSVPQVEAFISHFSEKHFAIIGHAPELVIALVIPAIRSFLTAEIETFVDPGNETLTICDSCREPIDTSDRFCRNCGAAQVQ